MIKNVKAKAAVIGMGHSRVYRRAEEPLGKLAVDAAREAIKNAGLKISDIDGITTAPMFPADGTPPVEGMTFVGTGYMTKSLGLTPTYADQGFFMVTQAFVQAVNAVAAGNAKHVLVFRALYNPDGRYGRALATVAAGDGQFGAPYGLSFVAVAAMLIQRYMHKYGATREQLGRFIVRNRDNGLKWPHGYWANYRPERLTLDDYMNARMICSPLTVYDCDLPIQGVGAFVLTSPERAVGLVDSPAYVLGTAISPVAYSGTYGSGFGDLLEYYQEVGRALGRNLWADAGIDVKDIDIANLYDGFSMLTPLWAEALGFCGEGEGFAWIADPDKPLNPAGGSLGAGRMHGIAHLMECCLQVTGRAGERQIPDARYSVATMATVQLGGGIVFGREPG